MLLSQEGVIGNGLLVKQMTCLLLLLHRSLATAPSHKTLEKDTHLWHPQDRVVHICIT